MRTTNTQRRKGFSVIFALELWERFGFYGVQAVLTIFMVQQLGLSDQRINMLLGASSALTYIMPILGGILGDRFLGSRPAMLLGAIGLISGYTTLSLFAQSFTGLIAALALIAVGNGLFKPNAGNLVRKIYADDDTALDTVFTLYYMSVNLGSMVSMLVTPWLQLSFGPNIAFATCAIGLAIGLGYYAFRAQWLRNVINDPVPVRLSALRVGFVGVATIIAVFLSAVVLQDEWIARQGIIISTLGLIGLWIWLYKQVNVEERLRLVCAYALSVFGALYYVYYQQSITSLTLYTLRDVSGDFTLFGRVLFHLSPGQFQALNSFWVFSLSPILAWIYQYLNKRQCEPSIGQKMLIGYMSLTGAFLIWWLFSCTTSTAVSAWVMFAGYGFMSLSELLTGGLGLAVVARYVPERFGGVVNGSVYALWGVAMYVGSILANSAHYVAGKNDGASLYVPLFKELCYISFGIVFVGYLVRWLGIRCFKLRS